MLQSEIRSIYYDLSKDFTFKKEKIKICSSRDEFSEELELVRHDKIGRRIP